MKKIVIILMIFFTIACEKKNTGTLIVGMELAYPPFETKDEFGNPQGISVDLAHALGEYLNKEVIIENTAWNGLIPALQTGKVDVVISSMTITEDRKQQVSFSDPYAKTRFAMLVNKNSPVNSLEDLNQSGRIIAVKQGTTPFLYAQKHLTNAQINSFNSESAASTEVSQGKADVMMYDQLSILYSYQRHSNVTRVVQIPRGTPDIDQYWGMAVKKDNTELLDQINQFLVEFKQKNGYDQLIEDHLLLEKQEFDKLDLEFFF